MLSRTSHDQRSHVELITVYEICRILCASLDIDRTFRAALNVLAAASASASSARPLFSRIIAIVCRSIASVSGSSLHRPESNSAPARRLWLKFPIQTKRARSSISLNN